jgi:hypothetical protein
VLNLITPASQAHGNRWPLRVSLAFLPKVKTVGINPMAVSTIS